MRPRTFASTSLSLIILALALFAAPARAVDVAGAVVNKDGAPLFQAKICLKSDASKCTITDLQGAFHLVTSIGIRETSPQAAAYAMDFRNGNLFLEAPAAASAQVEWTGPGGRTFFASEAVHLGRGRNALSLPKGLPENGVCFIRVRTPDLTLTWKAVLMGSQGKAAAGAQGKSSARIVALAKASGISTLEVSKSGYRTRNYEPFSDPETNALILMSATTDVGVAFTGSFNAKVLSLDRAAKTMVVENVDKYCVGPDIVRDTTQDTSLFAFRDGKFWLWSKGECTGQIFTSPGTDPVGTFTLVDPTADLPTDLKAGCDTSVHAGPTPFESFNAIYKVTETQLSGDISVEICPADFYGPLFSRIFFSDSNITLSKNTCQQLVFKNKAGESGTMNFKKQGDSLGFNFVYKTKTCSAAQDFTLSNKEPVCPEDSSSMQTFVSCLLTSGFIDTTGLGGPPAAAKTSALSPLKEPARFRGLPMSQVLPMSHEPKPSPLSFRSPAGVKIPVPVRRESIFPWHGWPFKTPR